jgi:ABC-type transport system involved in multi-copper enzyme maturation permease subunit
VGYVLVQAQGDDVVIERGPLCAYLAAEIFKMRHSNLAKVALGTMGATPLIAIGIVWSLGSSASVFPEVMPVIGASFWLLAGLTSLLLTAGSIGDEFELGTVQVVVGRGTPRWLFVLGKASVLLGAAAINVLVGWFCGGLMAVVSHLIQVGMQGLGEGLRILLTSGLAAVGIAVLSAASYIGLTMVVGVLTRTTAFTMFGGMAFFVVDFLLGGFTPIPGWKEKGLGAFSVIGNTNLLLNRLSYAMGADWSATVHPDIGSGTAISVLACYAIGGAILSSVLFRRQDLRGKS